MSKRLLIFGGCGFVGGTVAKLSAKRGFETAIAGHSRKPGFDELAFYTVDITNGDQVRAAIATFRPDAVVNAAAMSDIDRSEKSQAEAHGINVAGAANIAAAAASQGCRYLFISSDAVFDGKAQGYDEGAPTEPVNYYGRTKSEAELAVLKAHPSAVVIRVSLVLGFPVGGGNSFLAGLKRSLESGNAVACPVDEVRTPIDVHTLAESILELVLGNYAGTFHVASTQSIDRYRLALRAAELLGHDQSLIKMKPQAQTPEPGRAARHKNGILRVTKAQTLLKTPMLGIDETLKRAMERNSHESA